MRLPHFRPASAAAIAAILILAGCAAEPGDEDIRQAYEKSVQSSTGRFIGGDLAQTVKVLSAKKVACQKSAEAPGYVCDFSYRTELPVVGVQEGLGKGRFVKGDQGWVLAE